MFATNAATYSKLSANLPEATSVMLNLLRTMILPLLYLLWTESVVKDWFLSTADSYPYRLAGYLTLAAFAGLTLLLTVHDLRKVWISLLVFLNVFKIGRAHVCTPV